MAYDWLNMLTKVSEHLYSAFFVKMGKKTRAQQERGNELRRIQTSKTRQAVFIAEYIQFKYFHVYAEAASFYNALNTLYPTKYDLRKTTEYREWKMVINGETVKTKRKPPHHQNIENTTMPQSPEEDSIPPQSPEEDSIPPQSPQADSIPPQSPEEDSIPPQSPQADSIPPQSPEEDSIPPQSPQADSIPPQSPEEDSIPPQSPQADSIPPQSPKPSVYNDSMQLRIPLLQYEPKTPRKSPPTVTTETLEIITEKTLDESAIEPSILEELTPERISQIINELRQDDEIQNIFTEIEQQIQFEQLGMDIDIPQYDMLENELLLW